VRTKRFQGVMDRLGNRRISRPSGWLLLYLMPVAAAIGFFVFISELGILLSPRGPEVVSYIRSLTPLANLGLPGINPYLPVVDGWLALFVAMVVHEGAHGVVARSLGLPVKSSGLLFLLFIPIGAFVDVEEKTLVEAPPSYAGRVIGAGAGINLLLSFVCLLLLIGAVSAMQPASPQGIGATVVSPSPLQKAGVMTGDFILAVNGQPIGSISDIASSPWYRIGDTVNVTVWRDGTTFFTNVTIGNQTLQDVNNGTTYLRPFIGLNTGSTRSAAELGNLVSFYDGSLLSRPAIFLCIPTFPNCQGLVPFSDFNAVFYSSTLGPALVPLATLMYWFFFINFNLAIFNALPIYPLDGGQAFRIGVKAAGRGSLAEKTVMRITWAGTAVVALLVLGVIVGPYIIP
jgi:membrane-associated protease RseP (regulator of RpoE activity)